MLSQYSKLKQNVFEGFHKCPWYKNIFKHHNPTFEIIEKNTFIGVKQFVKCNVCGEEYDITDYELW